MTRQAAVLAAPPVQEHAPLLAKALAKVGHPPTRARGTIGGSLAHADPAAELPAAMLACQAQFLLRTSGGERWIAAADFFRGIFDTALKPGELLAEIRLPLQTGGAAFEEVCLRKGEFAIAAAAAQLRIGSDGRCRVARLVLGALAPAPFACEEVAARLVGRVLDATIIADAIEALPIERIELENPSASLAYRRRVAPVLARRALAAAAGIAA